MTCAAASAAAGCRCKTAGGLECRLVFGMCVCLVFDLQNSRSCVVFSPNADAAECLRRHVGRTERAPAGVVGGGSKPMGASHCRTVLSCRVCLALLAACCCLLGVVVWSAGQDCYDSDAYGWRLQLCWCDRSQRMRDIQTVLPELLIRYGCVQ